MGTGEQQRMGGCRGDRRWLLARAGWTGKNPRRVGCIGSLTERPHFPREQLPCSGLDMETLRISPPATEGYHLGVQVVGLGLSYQKGGRGSCHLALQGLPVSVWICTLGCIDIWDELDTHHSEREINKPSPYSSAIFLEKALFRHSAENIYNVLALW